LEGPLPERERQGHPPLDHAARLPCAEALPGLSLDPSGALGRREVSWPKADWTHKRWATGDLSDLGGAFRDHQGNRHMTWRMAEKDGLPCRTASTGGQMSA